MRAVLALWVTTCVLLSGCLSQTHTIPAHELHTLALQNPAERGRRVRVVQNFESEDEPPEAPPVTSHTAVVVDVPVGPAPAPAPRPQPGRHGTGSSLAKAKSDRAAYWVLIAAAVAVGLAVTEGLRFDGWVELHPMHPVHLYGYHGEYTWMPLAHLTPETAAWARKAVVREAEGPWHRLERAPLDRRGLTYAVLLGTTELPIVGGDESRGFMSHIQLGGFFNRELGLLFDIGLGWGEDRFGNTIYDSRNALELVLMPLSAGKLHLGGFGQLGFGRRFDDGAMEGNRFSTLFAGGGLLQLELTTRLAITARAGITQVYGTTTSDFTLGLSIY